MADDLLCHKLRIYHALRSTYIYVVTLSEAVRCGRACSALQRSLSEHFVAAEVNPYGVQLLRQCCQIFRVKNLGRPPSSPPVTQDEDRRDPGGRSIAAAKRAHVRVHVRLRSDNGRAHAHGMWMTMVDQPDLT